METIHETSLTMNAVVFIRASLYFDKLKEDKFLVLTSSRLINMIFK